MSGMRARRLNLAFLGCGAITAAHGRTLRRFRDRVRCFYASRHAEKAMAFERRFGGGGSFASYGAALADGRVDAVFVATPPAAHLDLTLDALEQGKDVIVEKPAFLCAADFDRVAAAQAASGRRVFVAENYCYKPLARVLRETLTAGLIGEVRFLQVNALKDQATAGWRNDPAPVGRALFEGGIHWIVEGFETFKFFRSPVVALLWSALVACFSRDYLHIALCGLGYTVATIETYKTFFFPNKPRGKFAGKPVRFPLFLSWRYHFAPLYAAIWVAVALNIAAAFTEPRQGLLSVGPGLRAPGCSERDGA